jgi:hypothetical protein
LHHRRIVSDIYFIAASAGGLCHYFAMPDACHISPLFDNCSVVLD